MEHTCAGCPYWTGECGWPASPFHRSRRKPTDLACLQREAELEQEKGEGDGQPYS